MKFYLWCNLSCPGFVDKNLSDGWIDSFCRFRCLRQRLSGCRTRFRSDPVRFRHRRRSQVNSIGDWFRPQWRQLAPDWNSSSRPRSSSPNSGRVVSVRLDVTENQVRALWPQRWRIRGRSSGWGRPGVAKATEINFRFSRLPRIFYFERENEKPLGIDHQVFTGWSTVDERGMWRWVIVR